MTGTERTHTAEERPKLAVRKPAPGGGFVFLNASMHWTPVIQFAKLWDPDYARHLAKLEHGYTANVEELYK
jgi:hypothetical protein